MTSVRTTYELPYLVQFITINKDKFGFPPIDIEILEDSFGLPDGLLVADLFARILRQILQKPTIRICSFQSHLVDLLKSTNAQWNPLKTIADYGGLTAVDKLKLLKWLADQTKEKDEIRDWLPDGLENLEHKEINVGTDSENRTYWYFRDLRLYRSKGSPQSKEGVVDWQCVAITLEEWQSLITELQKSTDEQEKDLYKYLNDDLFLPTIKLLLEQQANGTAVLKFKKPTDEELKASEESDIAKMMQTANTLDQIKSNPELSKVLSEETSTKPPKDHDKSREDHSKKSADDRKNDFTKTGPNQNGGMKTSQESVINHSSQVFVFSTQLANKAADATVSGSSHNSIISYHLEEPETKWFIQHQNIKLPQQIPPQGAMHPLRPTGPYGTMNGANSPHFPPQNSNIPPNHPGWNGQRMPMSGYGNLHPESPGVWGPGMNNHGPDIAHDIVPDENLTPEQREHREAGMASLRKIHEMLLEDRQGGMQPMTDFAHINMAQDEFNMYCGPGQGRSPMMGPGGQPMGPGGQPLGPGGQPIGPGGHMMGPGGPTMGPGGPPMGPGMMGPGHGHPHHLGSPMGPGPGPMHAGHPHMGPGGPMPPHMGGPPSHMDMGMYPGGPPMMHAKPPPPYPAPMAAPAPDAPPPRATKPKKRKSTTQPQSPMSQSLKSPKYQIPQSPLAGPPGMGPGMGPGFPMSDPGMPPTGHPQMYKPPHGAVPINGMPPHHAPQSNLMQAGPPEPFQGHSVANSVASHKPPPSYSQSTNKRGGLESMHTPPPHKQYYSQYEGQELTIIKQPNTAYQGPDQPGGDGNSGQFPAIPSHATRQPMTPGSPMNSRASNITHITSASLANLAKGVEQMQQSMVEGGPFRDLQQSGQPHPGMLPGGPNGGQVPLSSAAGTPLSGPNGIPSSSGGPHQPSVNNTFVNAHMSIAQVNIQNVNAAQQHTGFDSQGRPVQMQQNIEVTMNTGNMTPGTPRFPAEEPSYPNNANQPTNAAVKVQAKGPNTLQYLPVSQQAALPPANDPTVPKQPSFDFGRADQFATPLSNLENKTPISKISYYPDNSRLPPPPPQRLPHTVSINNPMTSQGNHSCMPQYSSPGPLPGMPMHSSPAAHMPSGMMPSHPHHPQFSTGHHGGPGGVVPSSSMYSPHGPYGPMPGTPGQELPPSSLGMMEPMHSPHMHSSQPMMMGHPHQSALPGHPGMMPHSPFTLQGPPEFGLPMHGGHPGYPGDFAPGMSGHPHALSRHMSHPGAVPGMPQQMIMSPPHGSPYMNGPAPGSNPYMMGGGGM